MDTLEINTPNDPVHAARLANFVAHYYLEGMIGAKESRFYLGSKENQTCRFCGKSKPEVRFRKIAHVIPEFMGNHTICSFFECDACNEKFSQYEQSMANYFGMDRTISKIKGKSGIPTFKNSKRLFRMEATEQTVSIEHTEGDDGLVLDEAAKKLSFTYPREPYTPNHIIKILLKIGLSLLKEEDLPNYTWMLEYLASDKLDEQRRGDKSLMVYGYWIPGPIVFDTPFAQLFARKPELESNMFDRILLLSYGRYFLQIAFVGDTDARLHGKRATIALFPLLISQSRTEKFGRGRMIKEDWTSPERVVGEDHTLIFSFDEMTEGPIEEIDI